MKKLPITFWLRLKHGWKAGVAVFLGCIAILGYILKALVNGPISFMTFGILSVICVILSGASAYIRGKLSLIPNQIIDELTSDERYSCRFCSSEALFEACEMTKPYYGHGYVSCDIAEQWRMTNPNAFIDIRNSQGELCACFGILVLQRSFMDQFIAGNVSDSQIRTNDILNFNESKKLGRIYISGVVVRDPHTVLGFKRARVMLWVILYYLKNKYGLRKNHTLYASAVTKDSEVLLKNLGFIILSPGKSRTDGYDLYSYELTRETWDRLAQKVGDYSLMCDIHF